MASRLDTPAKPRAARWVSQLLPPEARQLLIEAALEDKGRRIGESAERTRYLDSVLVKLKREYPQCFADAPRQMPEDPAIG
jgi:hypothetical protein